MRSKQWLKWIGAVVYSLFWLSSTATANAAEKAPLILGVLPRTSAIETVSSFTPIARYLSRRLGRPVEIETAPDMDSFWHQVEAGRYDLVNFNQLHYIRSHSRYGYEVILKNEEFGRSTIAGALVVRRDSPIRSLGDLKGARIIFGGGKTAMMGYVMNKTLLHQAGLTAADYREILAPNPINALIAVYHKQADVAGIGDVLMEMPWIDGRVDRNQVRVLAKSRPIPQLPWAVKKTMPRALRQQIQTVLVGLKDSAEGRAALRSARLTNLVTATDAEYDPLRRMVKDVLGEKVMK